MFLSFTFQKKISPSTEFRKNNFLKFFLSATENGVGDSGMRSNLSVFDTRLTRRRLPTPIPELE